MVGGECLKLMNLDIEVDWAMISNDEAEVGAYGDGNEGTFQ
jgi:hypothetical protein